MFQTQQQWTTPIIPEVPPNSPKFSRDLLIFDSDTESDSSSESASHPPNKKSYIEEHISHSQNTNFLSEDVIVQISYVENLSITNPSNHITLPTSSTTNETHFPRLRLPPS